MKKAAPVSESIEQPEPRWHALIAILAVAALYFALPDHLTIRPRWLFPAVVVALLVPTVITHTIKSDPTNRILGFMLSGVLTLGMIYSVVELVLTLSSDTSRPASEKIKAIDLLFYAGLLWFTNVIVFALWYWRLDAGGPHVREHRRGHPDGAFLFPQMTLPPEDTKVFNKKTNKFEKWSPNFIDYLFIAFNTSTAFSPTDAPPLTRWAKILMIIQSIISLTVIALLAARAVNTLS
jgi:hypothetical protein